jgi:hypothetical protein
MVLPWEIAIRVENREDAAEMRVPVEYNHRRLGVPPAQIGVQGGGRVFFHTEGHKGHEDTSFEQELTEETEENLTQFQDLTVPATVAEVDGTRWVHFLGRFYKPTITILLAPLVWRIAGTSLLQ